MVTGVDFILSVFRASDYVDLSEVTLLAVAQNNVPFEQNIYKRCIKNKWI
jgi:hypothetical protein